jgi:hypothetical protein
MSKMDLETPRNAASEITGTRDVGAPIIVVVDEGDRGAEPAPDASRLVSICSQNVTDD